MSQSIRRDELRNLAAAFVLLVPLAVLAPCSKGSRDGTAATSQSSNQASNRTDAREEPTILEKYVAPRTREVVVPQGTEVTILLTTPVSSQSNTEGDEVRGEIASDVLIGETVAIPQGSTVRGSVTVAQAQPKIGGRASLAFAFSSLELPDGTHVPIAATFARTGPSETRKDTATIIAGAIIGAVAGHQVDDDQGRGVGAVAGAGVGTAVAATTGKHPIVLPANTELRLTLRTSVPVEVDA